MRTGDDINQVVEHALGLWGMAGADYHLAAARENMVFQVSTKSGHTTGTQTFALRLHRKGYRTDAELESELMWMEEMARGGLSVPAPVASLSNNFLHVIDGIQVDVLRWLRGKPMGHARQPLEMADRDRRFHQLGQNMALLHDLSDGWELPDSFIRCAWNHKGLLGEQPLWGRFWDNPTLSHSDAELFAEFRDVAGAHLDRLEHELDYDLIHADLVRENIMLDDAHMHFIDFDDGGFGYRAFDLATTLLANMDEDDYPALQDAMISGYQSRRAMEREALGLFLTLRSTTYVGWIMARMEEEGAALRNGRFIHRARNLTKAYLAGDDVTLVC